MIRSLPSYLPSSPWCSASPGTVSVGHGGHAAALCVQPEALSDIPRVGAHYPFEQLHAAHHGIPLLPALLQQPPQQPHAPNMPQCLSQWPRVYGWQLPPLPNQFQSCPNRGNATYCSKSNQCIQVRINVHISTWDTSLWFSLSHVSLIAALRSKRAASISSFSCRINSFRRASSRSCSAFSSRSHACHTKHKNNMVSWCPATRIRILHAWWQFCATTQSWQTEIWNTYGMTLHYETRNFDGRRYV